MQNIFSNILQKRKSRLFVYRVQTQNQISTNVFFNCIFGIKNIFNLKKNCCTIGFKRKTKQFKNEKPRLGHSNMRLPCSNAEPNTTYCMGQSN
jgi:CDP-glycerol glycerophosphotransferase (TagB/SpsB family)